MAGTLGADATRKGGLRRLPANPPARWRWEHAEWPASKTSTARSSSTTTVRHGTVASSQSPPAVRVEGFNPLCGDEIVVTLDVDDGAVTDIKIGGTGCSISQSSASMMSAAVKGRSIDRGPRSHRHLQRDDVHPRGHPPGADHDGDGEIEPVDTETLGELAALQGVVKFPVRIKCATLSWNTLAQGLDEVGVPA